MVKTAAAEYVRLWLKRAVRDAKYALLAAQHREPDPVLALYLVQQSTEKACKALLFAAGKKYTRVVGFGHDSLKVFLSFTRTFVQAERMKQAISDLADQDVYVTLNQIANLAANPKQSLWKELASYDKAVVGKLTNIPELYRKRREKAMQLLQRSPRLTIEPSQLELANLVTIIKAYVADNLGHLIENWIDVTPTTAQTLIDMMGIRYTHEEVLQTGRVTLTGKELSKGFDGQLRFAELIVSLYIMSVITLPHEAFTRYPSDPGDSGQPPLGCEHYDDSIGAIAHIKKLSKRALFISQELHNNAEIVTAGIQVLIEATRAEREREEQRRRQRPARRRRPDRGRARR